jgi:hypothetical protein
MKGNLSWNGFIEDNPSDFANAAVELYTNETLWNNCQQNGFEILENRYDKSLFENDFFEKLNSLLQTLSHHRNQNFIGAILQHHFLASNKYMSKWIEEKNRN